MIITSAKYMKKIDGTGNSDTLRVIIDNVEMHVPQDPANRHYIAVKEWVAEGNKIEDAD